MANPLRPTSGIPLFSLITLGTVVLVGATTAIVGGSGFLGAQRSVEELWRELADHIAAETTAEALRLLQAAEPQTELASELTRLGRLSVDDGFGFLDHLAETADAYPQFTWMYYGHELDGRFVGVVRERDRALRGRIRRQLGGRRTEQVDYVRRADRWEDPVRTEEYFDPRERPWYRSAVASDHEGTWTNPYLFHGNREPGVTYARAVHTGDGVLTGVLAVDFEMAPLSAFLSRLRVGQQGRAFVVTRDGLVVADPQGRLIHESADGWAFWRAQDHPDPMLAGAWQAMQRSADPWAPLSFSVPEEPTHDGEMLAVATPFAGGTDIPWLVITVVPRDDLLGHAKERGLQALVYAGLALVVAVLLGAILSRVVAQSVSRLQRELLRAARFDLLDEPPVRSTIRELDTMGRATHVMKQGLRAFARYVPHQLVREVLASGRDATLGAERRELTVVFSDIEGFTTVVESTPPNEVLRALGDYLAGMNQAIESAGGVVLQYLGDGILALWGAPDPVEDHAVAACRGALAMMDHARQLADDAGNSGAPVLPTRIGIDTGHVMVGNIGAPDRFNYGVLGDTVNTASRLEQLNKQFQTRIVAGPRTAELARKAILFRPLDRVRLRGKQRATLVHEVMGEHDHVSEDTLAWVAKYTAALEVYFAGRFSEARAAFAAVAEKRPHDMPCKVMIDRCDVLAADPPGPDWDGVFDREPAT